MGYPFHPQKQPEKLRLSPLKSITLPTLILQGERDALGNQEEVPVKRRRGRPPKKPVGQQQHQQETAEKISDNGTALGNITIKVEGIFIKHSVCQVTRPQK